VTTSKSSADHQHFDLPQANEPALWAAVRAGDSLAREKLIETYLPFARMLAAHYFAGRIDHDQEFAEYLQSATLGLIEAVDRYDPGPQVLFKTYAGHRILGTIQNTLETLSEKRAQIAWKQRVERDRRDSAKLALRNENDLFHQLADVAISLALGFILDQPDTYRHEEANVPDPYRSVALRQLRGRMQSLVDQLPERERLIIKYHYFNQLAFDAVADSLGLTRGRVSQLHHQALNRLRTLAQAAESTDCAW
jgi:RNA polymerase sigma factor for flagellar operon FliA